MSLTGRGIHPGTLETRERPLPPTTTISRLSLDDLETSRALARHLEDESRPTPGHCVVVYVSPAGFGPEVIR